LLATSKASTSAVRRMKAFLRPFGVIKVLTFSASTWYILLTASLICFLLALTSQIKTRVLSSSIFFMADSVLSGNLRMLYWSTELTFGTETLGYFGLRARRRVFGLLKEVEVIIFLVALALTPLRAAFLAAAAFVVFY